MNTSSGYHSMRFQRNVIASLLLIVLLILAKSVTSNLSVAESLARQPAFLYKLDPDTGSMQVIQSVVAPHVTIQQEPLAIESVVMQYLVRRESYFFDTFDIDQEYVNLYSEGDALRSYQQMIDPSNPTSPAYNLADKGYAKAVATNIVKQPGLRYQVNWKLYIYPARGQTPTIIDNRAIISLQDFNQNKIPKKRYHRLLNPFGFKITHYQNHVETI